MQFEEVIVSDPNAGFVVEYITEEAEAVGTPVKNVPVSSTQTEGSVIKKKVPIIRKPGEIVTPLNRRVPADMKVAVSPSTPQLSSGKVLTVRSKVEWEKVEAPMSKIPFTSAPSLVTNEKATLPPIIDDESQEYETFDHEYAEVAAVSDKEPQTQMDRIEKKLDMILEKLNKHDVAIKTIKYSVKDLRVELKNSVNCLNDVPSGTFGPYNDVPIRAPKRKRLVSFPVADDNYLLRLEALLEADDQIRNEVTMLFKEAPRTSVYEFLRKNVYALFENCSKYTWTGKPSNANLTAPPTNVASKMALVDHLITCAWETFPNMTRESIAKDFRRALGNFNDTVYIKRRKRAELRMQTTGLMMDTNADADGE